MFTKNPTGKFKLGQIVATPEALDLLEERGVSAYGFLERHVQGDWGDVSTEDWLANDQALVDETRLISVYHIPDDEGEDVIWILTEADRSATTILLPSDY